MGCTHQVALVEQQQQVLVAQVLADVLLQEEAAGAHRVASVKHLLTGDMGEQQQSVVSKHDRSGATGAFTQCDEVLGGLRST